MRLVYQRFEHPLILVIGLRPVTSYRLDKAFAEPNAQTSGHAQRDLNSASNQSIRTRLVSRQSLESFKHYRAEPCNEMETHAPRVSIAARAKISLTFHSNP